MIPYLLILFWCLSVAYQEAKTDAQDILSGKPILHGSEFVQRAVLCLLAVFVAAFWTDHYWGSVVFFCGVAYGSFTPAFRYMLNKRRGLDYFYVSPGNEYDWMFIRLAFDRRMDRTELVEAWHVYMASTSAKRAGTIAYAVELFVLAVSTIVYLW